MGQSQSVDLHLHICESVPTHCPPCGQIGVIQGVFRRLEAQAS